MTDPWSHVKDVYVGNLPKDADEDKVRALMERFGAIITIKLFMVTEKRYGFVRYRDQCDAEACVNKASKQPLKMGESAVKIGWATQSKTPPVGNALPPHHGVPVNGWKCPDPNCQMWNEVVSPSCVQCNFYRHGAPNRHWGGGQQRHMFQAPGGIFPGPLYRPAFGGFAMQNANVGGGGAGRGKRAEQRREMMGMNPQWQDQSSGSSKGSSNGGAKQKENNPDVDLQLLTIVNKRKYLAEKKSSKAEKPQNVDEIIGKATKAMKDTIIKCESVHKKVYKLAEKQHNFYLDCEKAMKEEEDKDVVKMKKQALNASGKSLAQSVKEYLKIMPKHELTQALAKIDGLLETLVMQNEKLHNIKVTTLTCEETVTQVLKLKDTKHSSQKDEGVEGEGKSEEAVEELCQGLESIVKLLREEPSNVKALPVSLSKLLEGTKKTLENEAKQYRKVNQDENKAKQICKLLCNCHDVVVDQLKQYQIMYDLGESLEKAHGSKVLQSCPDPKELKLDSLSTSTGLMEKLNQSKSSFADDVEDFTVSFEEAGLEKEMEEKCKVKDLSSDDNLSDVLPLSEDEES